MNLRTYFDRTDRGQQVRLASLVGVRPPVVAGWVSGKRPIPISHMATIEAFTHGAVTRQAMRPADWQTIWPELAEAAASEPNQAAAHADQSQAAI